MDGCKVCGGPVILMGIMGTLAYYRCRNCGMEQFSRTSDPDPDPEDYADPNETGCGMRENAEAVEARARQDPDTWGDVLAEMRKLAR